MKSLGVTPVFLSVTALFFAWGFITSNNDPLIAALIASFRLTYTEALMIHLVSFAAFGLVSIPAAALLSRVGAHRAIMIALLMMVAGCLLVQLVTRLERFELILAGLFILAAGITILQVAANPLAAALGPAEGSHFRLTLAQAFNSFGVVIGTTFGSVVMLGDLAATTAQVAPDDPAQRILVLRGVAHAFLIMAVVLSLLAVAVWASRRPLEKQGLVGAGAGGSPLAALRSVWAVAGAVAIGLYVGAEVSISSILINFLSQPHILDIPLETAGLYLANVYWMGALIGRFAGSVLLTRVSAARLLLFAAVVAGLLCLIGAVTAGPVAAFATLAVGLFNSIMFPTIFSITLERSPAPQASTSGLLCLAIAGGAILPYVVGRIADHATLSAALLVPMVAYGAIAAFAAAARKRAPA